MTREPGAAEQLVPASGTGTYQHRPKELELQRTSSKVPLPEWGTENSITYLINPPNTVPM